GGPADGVEGLHLREAVLREVGPRAAAGDRAGEVLDHADILIPAVEGELAGLVVDPAQPGDRAARWQVGVRDRDRRPRADDLVGAAERLLEPAVDQPDDAAAEGELRGEGQVHAGRAAAGEGVDDRRLLPGVQARAVDPVATDVPQGPAALLG